MFHAFDLTAIGSGIKLGVYLLFHIISGRVIQPDKNLFSKLSALTRLVDIVLVMHMFYREVMNDLTLKCL